MEEGLSDFRSLALLSTKFHGPIRPNILTDSTLQPPSPLVYTNAAMVAHSTTRCSYSPGQALLGWAGASSFAACTCACGRV